MKFVYLQISSNGTFLFVVVRFEQAVRDIRASTTGCGPLICMGNLHISVNANLIWDRDYATGATLEGDVGKKLRRMFIEPGAAPRNQASRAESKDSLGRIFRSVARKREEFPFQTENVCCKAIQGKPGKRPHFVDAVRKGMRVYYYPRDGSREIHVYSASGMTVRTEVDDRKRCEDWWGQHPNDKNIMFPWWSIRKELGIGSSRLPTRLEVFDWVEERCRLFGVANADKVLFPYDSKKHGVTSEGVLEAYYQKIGGTVPLKRKAKQLPLSTLAPKKRKAKKLPPVSTVPLKRKAKKLPLSTLARKKREAKKIPPVSIAPKMRVPRKLQHPPAFIAPKTKTRVSLSAVARKMREASREKRSDSVATRTLSKEQSSDKKAASKKRDGTTGSSVSRTELSDKRKPEAKKRAAATAGMIHIDDGRGSGSDDSRDRKPAARKTHDLQVRRRRIQESSSSESEESLDTKPAARKTHDSR